MRKHDREKRIKLQKRDRLSRQSPPKTPTKQITFLPTCPGLFLSLQRTSPPSTVVTARQRHTISEKKVLILRDSAALFCPQSKWANAGWRQPCTCEQRGKKGRRGGGSGGRGRKAAPAHFE